MNQHLEVVEAVAGTDSVQPTLAEYLKGLAPGPIQHPSPVMRLLVDSWDDLEGSDDGGMKWDKLLGRCEDLSWDPPHLTFKIERHGATVNGSSRAELQHWSVDPTLRQACIVKSGKRQLYPISKKLDVGKLAEAVVDDIGNHRESPKLKWYYDGRVKVIVNQVIPTTNAQTTTTRRARFREALIRILAKLGWKEIAPHVYQKKAVESP